MTSSNRMNDWSHWWLALVCIASVLAACGDDEEPVPPFCPTGQIRIDGLCVSYTPGEPLPHDGLWRPPTGTTWQWQLTGAIDSSYDVAMYDVDLFEVTDEELAALADRTVICYFSAGSWEEWRDDADQFPSEALGYTLEGWEDERWLDITHPRVRELMMERLNIAVARGCDGVEPDNVDGYQNNNGLGLNETEQLAYNRFIADEAHARGLSVGLKNDIDQLEALIDWYDWALNEECHAYDECDQYQVFANAGLAVFHVEYVDSWSAAESRAAAVCGRYPALSTLIKTWDLGPEFLACE